MIKLFADNTNKVISENYGIMPKNIETKLVCPVNNFEQNLVLIELKNQRKLLIDLINMIKIFIQERKNSKYL